MKRLLGGKRAAHAEARGPFHERLTLPVCGEDDRLKGMVTDRDIALQNVRYVLSGAGNLHEDFVPAPGGFIQQRAHQVLAEAVELLERIVDDTLLNAIADGTFGIMKRPADRGKGLDGVARHADDYYNPVTEALT